MSAHENTRIHFNQRKSLRMGVADPDENVVLCHGRQRSRARVIDVSTGGFGVEVGSDVMFLLDQKIQLETDSWIHDVRVTHVKKGDGVNRVGLERISDRPLGNARAFMRKVRHSANFLNMLLNCVRGIGGVLNPDKWQHSASFLTTVAICTLLFSASYLIKNGELGGSRGSWMTSSKRRAVKAPRSSSRTDYSTSQTAYQSWETGRSPNSLGERLKPSWVDLRMIFKPGDILSELITRTVAYNNAPPGPPGLPGEMSSFNQKMQASWDQFKEQIRSADAFLRNQQENSDPKTGGRVTDDPSAEKTGSNPDNSDGNVDGTSGNQQGNEPYPTSRTPSSSTGPSSNPGGSSTTNPTNQTGSATP